MLISFFKQQDLAVMTAWFKKRKTGGFQEIGTATKLITFFKK